MEEKIFTVGELIKWLEQLPKDTPIMDDTGFFFDRNPFYYGGEYVTF